MRAEQQFAQYTGFQLNFATHARLERCCVRDVQANHPDFKTISDSPQSGVARKSRSSERHTAFLARPLPPPSLPGAHGICQLEKGSMNDDLLGDENVRDSVACNSSIAARLEALRRDAQVVGASSAAVLPRPQLDINHAHQTAAETGPDKQQKAARSLAALAAELFGDERFKAACAKGLHARLQVRLPPVRQPR